MLVGVNYTKTHHFIFLMIALLLNLASSFVFQPHEEKSFVSWMRTHNSIYTGDEYFMRFGIYLANSRLVAQQNKKSSFKVSLNKFAAHTPAEYSALIQDKYSYQEPAANSEEIKPKTIKQESVDWRKKGVVTDVKDQGNCAAGWAFSSVAIAESSWAINTTKLFRLSEQNLLDCSGHCTGGSVFFCILFIIVDQRGKVMKEEDYPYVGVKERCNYDKTKGIGDFHSSNRALSEGLLEVYVSEGPVAATIDASASLFKLYSKGIFDDDSCSDKKINHGIAVVGYGSENGVDYWILKNSWGKSWGEEGYVRFLRGKELCGITKDAWTISPQIIPQP